MTTSHETKTVTYDGMTLTPEVASVYRLAELLQQLIAEYGPVAAFAGAVAHGLIAQANIPRGEAEEISARAGALCGMYDKAGQFPAAGQA